MTEQSERVPPPTRAAVQRFGSQLWQRVTARFPALDDLLVDITASVDRASNDRTHTLQQASVEAPRARVVEAVQQVGDFQALLGALRDTSAEVAAAAAIALTDFEDPAQRTECRFALLEVLHNADSYFHPLTRVAALQGLVRILRVPAMRAELEPLLLSVRDMDAEVSMAAIAAVATHAPVDVVIDCLSPVVLDRSGFFLPMVQLAATRALERIGHRQL